MDPQALDVARLVIDERVRDAIDRSKARTVKRQRQTPAHPPAGGPREWSLMVLRRVLS